MKAGSILLLTTMKAAVTYVSPANPNTIARMTVKKVLTPCNAASALAIASASSLRMIELDAERIGS